jgi:hypothetical protein
MTRARNRRQILGVPRLANDKNREDFRGKSQTMELTDKKFHLLARLSRDRSLYAECKGAALDALQELGLQNGFDTRSSTTPFRQDPRPFLRLHGVRGRMDYAWVGVAENRRELVGQEVSTEVDAIDKIEWAVTGRSLE